MEYACASTCIWSKDKAASCVDPLELGAILGAVCIMTEFETGASSGADAAAATGFGGTAADMIGADADGNAPENAFADPGGLTAALARYSGLSNDCDAESPDAIERLPVTVVVVVLTEVETVLPRCAII